MTDHLTPEKRSWNMSRIRAVDTKPELKVRSLVHRLGYRFRLHATKLPGKPDLVLARHKTVIFVHGCFWHRHKGCKRCTTPSSNKDYWKKKFKRNINKDKENKHSLHKNGWKVIIIWECETADEERLKRILCKKLAKT